MTPEERILEQILQLKYPKGRNRSSEKMRNRTNIDKRNLIQPVNMFNSPSHTIVNNHQFIHKDIFKESKEKFSTAPTYLRYFSPEEIPNFDLTSISFDNYNKSKEREVQLNRDLT